MSNKPNYPIYIPTKGRVDHCLTADCLVEDGVPFKLVVEPQEEDAYKGKYGNEYILVLPFRDRGSVIPARNWIKDHATEAGHLRHWQLDDNIYKFYRFWKDKRVRCDADIALRTAEDFTDRYENIAISGLNYSMFMAASKPPFNLNCHVYSCTLMLNAIPNRFRGIYNEDTDMCLQVLADGWCTVLINAFTADKEVSMQARGGNTKELYHGDGRTKMARALERRWKGVVTVGKRYSRAQHVIRDGWKRFDTPLKRKEGLVINKEPNEYGMRLEQVASKIKSARIQAIKDEYND